LAFKDASQFLVYLSLEKLPWSAAKKAVTYHIYRDGGTQAWTDNR